MVTEAAAPAAVTGGMALLGMGCWAESARVERMMKEKSRVSVRMKNLLDL
jgi:hypothetical protein